MLAGTSLGPEKGIGDQKKEGLFSTFSVSFWGIHQMQLTIKFGVVLMSSTVYLFILDFKNNCLYPVGACLVPVEKCW